MPLRGLAYLLRILNAYVHTRGLNIYGEKLQRLPTPDYVVLYNGERKAPDCEVLRLTDAFDRPDRACVEMKARVYNINYGCNQELMSRCEPLRGYAILVDKIRRYQKEGLSVRDAADKAVDMCVRENILRDFLIKHRTEVAVMFLSEYNEAERLRLEKKESLEDGIEIGKKQGIEIGEKRGIEIGEKRGEKRGAENSLVFSIKNLMQSTGWTVEATIKALRVPEEERESYASLVNEQLTQSA